MTIDQTETRTIPVLNYKNVDAASTYLAQFIIGPDPSGDADTFEFMNDLPQPDDEVVPFHLQASNDWGDVVVVKELDFAATEQTLVDLACDQIYLAIEAVEDTVTLILF